MTGLNGLYGRPYRSYIDLDDLKNTPADGEHGPSIDDIDDIDDPPFFDWADHRPLGPVELDELYRSSGISEIKDATYIFLGENHLSERSRHDHSFLIDQLVTPGSILLVEGAPALIEMLETKREEFFRLFKISNKAQRMLTVIGWDHRTHLFPGYNEPDWICQYDKEAGKIDIFSSISESILPAIRDNAFLFSSEKRLLLQTRLKSNTCKFPIEARQTLKEIEALASRIPTELTKELEKNFPIRTQTMVHTLKILEEQRLQGNITGKIFLIAGLSHLLVECQDASPQYSLKLLRETLSTLPAVVLSSVHSTNLF